MAQLAILDDLKRGMTNNKVARAYNVDNMVVVRRRKHGPGSAWFDLPEEFKLLTVGSTLVGL